MENNIFFNFSAWGGWMANEQVFLSVFGHGTEARPGRALPGVAELAPMKRDSLSAAAGAGNKARELSAGTSVACGGSWSAPRRET